MLARSRPPATYRIFVVRGNPGRSSSSARGNHCSAAKLMAWPVLAHLLDLLLHRFEVERRRVLHRRIIDRRLRQLRDILLHEHEAPELAGEEVVAVTERACVGRFAANI